MKIEMGIMLWEKVTTRSVDRSLRVGSARSTPPNGKYLSAAEPVSEISDAPPKLFVIGFAGEPSARDQTKRITIHAKAASHPAKIKLGNVVGEWPDMAEHLC